ncbi:MAG: glycosyltransferase family 39 protein [Pyrinomonadaceae bacterium]|nr:glycosyltransferase family 39 protein [Pyrinomonadaceae bacterium]
MSASAETVITARIRPELFEKCGLQVRSRTLLVAALAIITLLGFGFRASQLSSEGLSEDELNKLQAVEEYRHHGLSSINGEHPFLMKALMTASVVAAERWNASTVAAGNPSAQVSVETALRLPVTIFGAATALLIFLLVSELFGTEIALIAATLWALDPTAISFNRIAKEDTFLLFFFLLANVFWLRSQRVAESGKRNPEPLYWATAAAYGAMMASKYMPHLMAVGVSYYYIFQGIPQTRWRMGKKRFLIFFAVMGVVFLILNPTILLPGTWHEMKIFAGEKRIGHGSYEFMGTLYLNQMSLWLKGMPWSFYYVFMGVKLPLTTLAAFLVGLPLLLRKRLGDGRFFLFFWLVFWFMPFTVMGGKYTRYFTTALPVVLITAAIGIHFVAQHLARLLKTAFDSERAGAMTQASVVALVLTVTAVAAASALPYYRLYTNALGAGLADVGSYFPHDEFYDASVRDAAREVARIARPGARVTSETPGLFEYYTRLAGRSDLTFVRLSDEEAMQEVGAGDIIIVARGRRYLSNDALTTNLEKNYAPAVTVSLGQVPSVKIFVLDRAVGEALAGNVRP